MERRGNVVERYDWAAWVVLGLVFVMFGVGDLQQGGSTLASAESVLFEGISGMTWNELLAADPGAARFIDYEVRLGGASFIAFGLFTLALSVLGLRRGQRAAWLTLWLWPLSFVLTVAVLLSTEKVPGAGVPVPLIGQPILGIIMVVLLLLTYRKYNPSR
jgi:hypothetical protein